MKTECERFGTKGEKAGWSARPTCRNLAIKKSDQFICSVCGESVDIAYLDSADDYHAKFCPNCGAEVVK